MRAWGEESPWANMHNGRLLALIKKACPGNEPKIERVIPCGFLTQVVQTHIFAGGDDPRIVTRKGLLEAGAPLQARRCARRLGTEEDVNPKKKRVKLLHMNKQYTEEKRRRAAAGDKKPIPRQEANASRRSF